MKKIVIKVIILLFTINGFSQNKPDVSVEKSLYGVQVGFLGAWLHNEARLTNTIALRTEIGFQSGVFGGAAYKTTNFILFPELSVSLRWYYNLDKRKSRNKTTLKNSANFLSIRFNYIPDTFVISNLDDISISQSIAIVPKWAIKRTIGTNFTYETGIGFGYRKYLEAGVEGNAVLDLHLRIGLSL